VTSAVPPAGLDVTALRNVLNQKFGVVIAGGQGKMTGKMIRVGHLGAVAEGDVVQVVWAIEQALEELDIALSDGRGVAGVTASLQGVAAATR
jgi:aspartate aminotransferase-like enzyme